MAMTNRGKKEDVINHPTHYTQGYCETIYEIYDILGPEGFKSYCLGNWIKYKSRARYKNGDEDLKKAEVYLGWATNGLTRPSDDKYFKMEVGLNSIDPPTTFAGVGDFKIGDRVQFYSTGGYMRGVITRFYLDGANKTVSIIGDDGIVYRIDLSKINKIELKCDGNHGEPRCNDPECWLK